MSGICGFLHLDGAPVLPEILHQLTDFLTFRGPDGQRTSVHGNVGFGAAFLNVDGDERASALVRDGELCIVADARIDGRRELEGKLRSGARHALAGDSDAGLILQAYRQWGEKCLEHLLGDFAFAIWDGPRRRLFCARDQMGIKPFFYAHVGPLLIFSNTLGCIRQHPAISNRLNDLSIADFLLFDLIQDPEGTAFADVRRLPPAHFLVGDPIAGVSVRRYWTPPVTPALEYRHAGEYVEHFRELFDVAVADRLGLGNACVFMSGGLDSSMVAASAMRLASRESGSARVWAFTQVFDSLLPHDERQYASMVAQALQIPIEYRADDHLRLFQFAEKPEYWSPEPMHSAWPNVVIDHLRRVSSEGRVVLTGLGADPLFSSRISVHFRELLGQNRWGRALADAARYFSAEGRLSRLYLRTRWRILFAPKGFSYGFFPPWLDEDFAKNLGLRERWESLAGATMPAGAGAIRPEAHQVTFAPFWPDVLGAYEAGVTGVPVEVRHPFFDLRLMTFLLALRRLPWCCDKQMLREAGRGVLPDAVRLRRKSPLRAHPLLKLLERPEAAWVDGFEGSSALQPYVNREQIPGVLGETDPWAAWVNLRPLSLEYWLRGLDLPGSRGPDCPEFAASSRRHSKAY